LFRSSVKQSARSKAAVYNWESTVLL